MYQSQPPNLSYPLFPLATLNLLIQVDHMIKTTKAPHVHVFVVNLIST